VYRGGCWTRGLAIEKFLATLDAPSLKLRLWFERPLRRLRVANRAPPHVSKGLPRKEARGARDITTADGAVRQARLFTNGFSKLACDQPGPL